MSKGARLVMRLVGDSGAGLFAWAGVTHGVALLWWMAAAALVGMCYALANQETSAGA